MPKFSDSEKQMIQEKLHTEGERLFTLYGIKKVTVDDLVKAAGIAKGSFYAFYSNKEYLYMSILERIQRKVWQDMDVFLDGHRTLLPKELMKKALLWSLDQLQKYPMLLLVDTETVDYLFRKLPKEMIELHTQEDAFFLRKLQEYGISFNCEADLAAKALQVLVISFLELKKEQYGRQVAVMELIVNGVVNEIVGDKND